MPLVKEINWNGYRMRSKIEAKWALFFETISVQYFYEPDTIALKRGDKIVNYLPDYFLPNFECYIEIKLDKCPTVDECSKCHMLAVQTGKDVFLFYEELGKKHTNGYMYKGTTGAFLPQMRFVQCPRCSAFGITHMGLVAAMKCGCCKNDGDITNSESYALKEAVKQVRSERFGA